MHSWTSLWRYEVSGRDYFQGKKLMDWRRRWRLMLATDTIHNCIFATSQLLFLLSVLEFALCFPKQSQNSLYEGSCHQSLKNNFIHIYDIPVSGNNRNLDHDLFLLSDPSMRWWANIFWRPCCRQYTHQSVDASEYLYRRRFFEI